MKYDISLESLFLFILILIGSKIYIYCNHKNIACCTLELILSVPNIINIAALIWNYSYIYIFNSKLSRLD